MGVLGSSDFPGLLHLCYTPSDCSYTVNHSSCLQPIASIHLLFLLLFLDQRGTSKDTEQQSGMSVIEKRVGEVLCWWLAGANPLVRQPAVHEVRGCPQQCLSTAAPFSLCPCSSMGPLWATVPSEVHLPFHELINGQEALQGSTCSATEHLPVL